MWLGTFICQKQVLYPLNVNYLLLLYSLHTHTHAQTHTRTTHQPCYVVYDCVETLTVILFIVFIWDWNLYRDGQLLVWKYIISSFFAITMSESECS